MPSIVTQMPLTLSFFISDIATALADFNRLRVLRSRNGADGIYEEATTAAAQPAHIQGVLAEPHRLNGKSLVLRINGVSTLTIPFAGADPYSTAAVISDIAAVTSLVVGTAGPLGELILTTATTGTNSSVEVLECSAAPFLGFQTGDAGIGTDTDVVLAPNTHEYRYTDRASSMDFVYKFQLRSSSTLEVSKLSVPVPASQAQSVDYANTIACFIRLMDSSGVPLAGRKVTFSNVHLPNIVAGRGVFRQYTSMSTDRDGYAEARLLRGMLVDVGIEGTNFTRRLQIPTTGDAVDLLDASLVAEDEFGIQRPNINFAIRTS